MRPGGIDERQGELARRSRPSAGAAILTAWCFHWVTAGLVAVIFLTSLPIDALGFLRPTGFSWTRSHLSIGIVVMLVTLARMPWKWVCRRLTGRSASQSARLIQWSLLALLIALSISGLLAFQQPPMAPPFRMFGLIRMASVLDLDHSVHQAIILIHKVLAYGLLALLLLHIGYAFNRQTMVRRRVARMLWPWSG